MPVHVAKRENPIVNRLNKTKVEREVDHEAEKVERLKKESAARRAAAAAKVGDFPLSMSLTFLTPPTEKDRPRTRARARSAKESVVIRLFIQRRTRLGRRAGKANRQGTRRRLHVTAPLRIDFCSILPTPSSTSDRLLEQTSVQPPRDAPLGVVEPQPCFLASLANSASLLVDLMPADGLAGFLSSLGLLSPMSHQKIFGEG